MKRALIIKMGAIGDVVMAVPGAYQLHLAGYGVDWVCGAAARPVLELYPWIRVIGVDERAILKGSAGVRARAIGGLWRRLLGTRYDVVATLYYDRRYRVLGLPVRAGRRVMLSATKRGERLLPGRHHTDEYARVLLGGADTRREGALAPLRAEGLPASPLARDGRRRVVMAAGGAKNMMADDALRRWPAEEYAALAGLLLARGVEVVLIGGQEDGWVREFFQGLGVVDLVGRLALVETLALLDEADVLVTHDTGPLHLGGITRCGIVGLFGPTDPRGRLPQRPGTVALWGGEGFACRPCYDGHGFAECERNDCIRQYSAERVAGVVMEMLEERARGVMRAPRVDVPLSVVGGLNG